MTEGKQPRVLVADDEDAIAHPRGFRQAAEKERLHQLCCILSKPFDMDELIQVLRDCTRCRSRQSASSVRSTSSILSMSKGFCNTSVSAGNRSAKYREMADSTITFGLVGSA